MRARDSASAPRVVSASSLLARRLHREHRSAADPIQPDAIRVAAFGFTESEILAELYSQALEAKGYPTGPGLQRRPEGARATGAGGRADRCRARVRRLGPRLPHARRPRREPRASARHHDALTSWWSRRSDIDRAGAGPRPGFERDRRDAGDGRSIRACATSATSPPWTRGSCSAAHRSARSGACAWSASRACTGSSFREFIPLDTGGPLTLQALRSGGIDVALLFTTDPAIVSEGLVVLTDDRGLQPSENVTPLLRREVLSTHGDGVDPDPGCRLVTPHDLEPASDDRPSRGGKAGA